MEKQHYLSATTGRDLRFDFIRGFAMAIVVVNHLPAPSYFYVFSQERIGVVTGAEIFVIICGLVLGLTHRSYIERGSWRQSAGKLVRRAGLLYLCVVVVSLLAWVMAQMVPKFGLLTVWTDASGVDVPLYLEHPRSHPLRLLGDILFIKSTPWQFNIIGLYVLLILASPLALWLLFKQRAGWLMAISVSLYIIPHVFQVRRLTPMAFENAFPLLAWQLPFVLGMIAGYHHRRLGAWLRTRWGTVARVAVVALFCGGIFFALNNYWLNQSYPFMPGLQLIDPDSFFAVYSTVFLERYLLAPGRLINSMVVVGALCEVLNLAWPVWAKFIGWWTIPVGQASLYVFILHLMMIPLSATINSHLGGGILPTTLSATLVLLTIWVCVKTRFLFRLIPR
jgi:hypothetical protein